MDSLQRCKLPEEEKRISSSEDRIISDADKNQADKNKAIMSEATDAL